MLLPTIPCCTFERDAVPDGTHNFGLLALGIGVYAMFSSQLYLSESVAEGAPWQRLQQVALSGLVTVFIYFVESTPHCTARADRARPGVQAIRLPRSTRLPGQVSKDRPRPGSVG